jgi:hypothetical protein
VPSAEKDKKVCGDSIYLLTKVITYQFSLSAELMGLAPAKK